MYDKLSTFYQKASTKRQARSARWEDYNIDSFAATKWVPLPYNHLSPSQLIMAFPFHSCYFLSPGSERRLRNQCRKLSLLQLHTFEQASSSPWLIADAPGSCWPRDALATNVDFQSNPATSFWFVKASRGRWDFSNLRWKTMMMVWEKVEGKGTSWWWSTWFPHSAMPHCNVLGARKEEEEWKTKSSTEKR